MLWSCTEVCRKAKTGKPLSSCNKQEDVSHGGKLRHTASYTVTTLYQEGVVLHKPMTGDAWTAN